MKASPASAVIAGLDPAIHLLAGWITGSRRFAALIAIIAFGGGFIPATAVLFAATAAAFGRKAVIVDLIIGAVLGSAAYLLFDKLLTLSLPAGPLERLL